MVYVNVWLSVFQNTVGNAGRKAQQPFEQVGFANVVFAITAFNSADDSGGDCVWCHFAGAASGGHAGGNERRDDFLYLDVWRSSFGLVTQGAGEVV